MSNKVVKKNQNKSRTVGAGTEIMGQLMEYLTAFLLIVLCVAVPFYAKDGYHGIGDAKFAAYKTIMLIGCAILTAATVPYLFFRLNEHEKPQVSVTDWFVIAYLILTVISVFFGGFYENVLWGHPGWYMGLMSQISFVLLYLFVSRFGKYYRMVLTVLCTAAGIVFVLGILHRLLIDPIGFYDGLENYQKAQFLSTLGQATWYASFLMVTLPVGIGVFLYAEGKAWSILSGIYMTTGFCTLVTQNSDSAYFALAGAMLVLFMLSAEDKRVFRRFMGALTLFFTAGKVMYLLMQINPNPDLEVDFITRLMWTSRITWVLLVLCLFFTVILYMADAGKRIWEYPTALMHRMRHIVPAAAVMIIVVIVLVICLQTRGALPEAVADKLSGISYFNWNDDWGNGRGRIWQFSARIYAEGSFVHKLLGVGPDGFNSYVSAYYSEDETLLWGQKQLTNAHNEWLSILVNGGILGAVAYLGIYVTSIRRFFCRYREDLCLAGITAACMSYLCYNFFCYQQVLCTPFIFILMGIGEYILRQSREERRS